VIEELVDEVAMAASNLRLGERRSILRPWQTGLPERTGQQRRDPFGRNGPRKEIALGDLATHAEQKRGLFTLFHAFGDGVFAYGVSQTEDR
jgi:hypothetical protein